LHSTSHLFKAVLGWEELPAVVEQTYGKLHIASKRSASFVRSSKLVWELHVQDVVVLHWVPYPSYYPCHLKHSCYQPPAIQLHATHLHKLHTQN
jgi:hypothetical protein